MSIDDDITLNVYVPSETDEIKNKSKKRISKRTYDSMTNVNQNQNAVKKKASNSFVVTKDIDEHITKSNVHGEKVKIKSENKSLKKTATTSKRFNITRKPANLFKKGSPKHSLGAVTTKDNLIRDQPKDGVVEISPNVNVEPIYEALFSANSFASLGSLHPHLVANLEQLFNITTMTIVQQKTIPVLLSKKDALIRSQTGSGKTLAYAVPILNFLQEIRPKISRSDGVKALIILPTRELALQTFECFQKLVRAFTWLVPGILIGGEKRKSEKARLRKGITILISTPGRLLDHSNRTSALSLKHVEWLILDEADKLLDFGYEEAIGSLLEVLRKEVSEKPQLPVQTVLLSATLTPGVERLAGLALDTPVRLDAVDENESSDDTSTPFVIPHTLDQKYIVVPPKLRLVVLAAIVIYHYQMGKSDKLLIFMATQDMVTFFIDLLSCVLIEKVSFFKLHGNMTQIERTEVFKKFRSETSGVLVCTDLGARGLDLPKTDVIIQFNAPHTPADYVHRVGRTARVGSSGTSILFLEPSEMNFLQWLNEKRIKLEEQDTETYLEVLNDLDLLKHNQFTKYRDIQDLASALQLKFEHALLDDKDLHAIACQAYKSWVRFYASYPKESITVFCYKKLHLGHHAKSFGLRDPPSKIGGIGRPSHLKAGRDKGRKVMKKKDNKLKIETMRDRTKRLIISEFDSGIKFKRK